MKVMKFGGTSVGSPERMKGVASLVTESGEPTFHRTFCDERYNKLTR